MNNSPPIKTANSVKSPAAKPAFQFAQAIKLLVLLLALVGVFAVIQNLQPQKVQNALHSLGVDAGNSAAPGFQPATSRTLEAGEERLNLCPTRIASVTWADGREVEESPSGIKRKWLAAFPRAAPREIGYLEVEKWLSQHCEVIAQLAEGVIVGADSAQRLAVVRYIDGSETVIDQTPQGLVKISQPGASARFYRSSDLKGALQELATIAQF